MVYNLRLVLTVNDDNFIMVGYDVERGCFHLFSPWGSKKIL